MPLLSHGRGYKMHALPEAGSFINLDDEQIA